MNESPPFTRPPGCGVVIIGHGSPVSEGVAEFHQLIALFRQRHPEMPCIGAFLEHAEPGIGQAARQSHSLLFIAGQGGITALRQVPSIDQLQRRMGDGPVLRAFGPGAIRAAAHQDHVQHGQRKIELTVLRQHRPQPCPFTQRPVAQSPAIHADFALIRREIPA